MKSLFFAVCLIFLLACSSQSVFLDDLPYSFKLNETTEADLMSKGFIKDITYKNDSLNRFENNEKNYCYTKKLNGKLSYMVVSKMPNSWAEKGLKPGITRTELITILTIHKIPFLVYAKGDDFILATSTNIDFSFMIASIDFESLGMKKGKLCQVAISPLNSTKHDNPKEYRKPTEEESGILITKKGMTENIAVDKYLGKWVSGNRYITITKFGNAYRLTGCENCPFTGVLKESILYVSAGGQQLPCPYDEKSDRILLDGREYMRDNN